jgi:hypothetical protein
MKYRLSWMGHALASLLVALAISSVSAAEPVIISEFLAANDGGLRDEDGESSDWIELYNTTRAPVNLAGWYLTDDPNDLTKWEFPATNILQNDFLLVFASAKDRRVPGAPLHANFSLTSGGEYLALVKPDGVTIATEFAPAFPEQFDNVSFGTVQSITVNRFVTSNTTGRVTIPTNSSLGLTWVSTSFNDSTWTAATNGVGYETTVPGFAVRNYKATFNVNTRADAESVISTPSFQSAVYAENRNVINYFNSGGGGNYGSDITFPGFTIGNDIEDFVIEATGTITIPAPGNYTFGVNSDDGFWLTIGSFTGGCDCLRGPSDTLLTFNFASAGEYPLRLVFWERGGGAGVELFAAAGAFGAFSPTSFRLVGDTGNGGLAIKSSPIGSGTTSVSLRSAIRTDVSSMFNRAAGAYVRLPFTLANTNQLSLVLQVKYDDGFVAYLNGSEIARRNVPASPQFSSRATASRTNNEPLTAESINISDFRHLLRVGANVLALHGMNDATNGTDFLIAADIVEYRATQTTNAFFATPTPGAFNNSSTVAFVADTKFTPNRGFYDTNFSLSITSATPGATIYYTTNGTEPKPGNGYVYSGPIPIGGTVTVRAAAHRNGFQSSDIDTHTYIFVNDVVNQSTNGAPPAGWPATWGGNVVDYGMDPDIVNAPPWNSTIREDLKALPVLSLVTTVSNLFDPANGIYSNPHGAGPAWERPASLELINPDGTKGFQINCGLRIRGGFSRSTDNPKHALRVFFREEYGEGKLRYPLFQKQNGASEFDGFDIRTFQNYSWSFGGDPSGIFMRDQLARDVQLAMGQQGERGDYYHLYINGQYWGVYNTCERPEASYAATYFGGDKEDYDVIKVDPQSGYTVLATDGNMDAWFRLWQAATNGLASDAAYQFIQGNNPDGTRNSTYENLLDVPNLIDYMLVILYGGNIDAPISQFLGNTSPNNWYGSRSRQNTGGFRFFAHDSEHTLLDVNSDRTGPFPAGDPVTGGGFPKSNPQYLWQQLSANAEFRMLVADRVQKHFFNGGALSVEAVRAAFMARSNELYRAVVCESARWGDSKRPTAPLTRNDWLGSVAGVWNGFIPQRSANIVNQLRAKGLFPNINAPSLSTTSGVVALGYPLTLSNPNASGTIYYTLDGSDPRLVGGGISPRAVAYSAPIVVNTFRHVRARVRNGSEWSAIVEGTFYPLQDYSGLLVTEVMFNPPMFGPVAADDVEFLELKNTGSTALDLSGAVFSGITFTFTNGTILQPGSFFVLGRNRTQLQAKYPGLAVQGVYSGRLDNSGERIGVTHALGAEIFSFTYNDNAPWPITPDGHGFSLVPRSPNANPDWSDGLNWRASSGSGGSPGADDPAVGIAPVIINEILTATVPPAVERIELWNPTASAVNVGGWFLTDDSNEPKKFRIPNGTTISADGYVSFSEAEFNSTPGSNGSFSLSSFGEEIYLLSGDANTNLTGYSFGFPFGAAAQDVSLGRHVNSVRDVFYPAQITSTFGAANSGPRVGPVVINEIHYHAPIGRFEFIELLNISSTNVALFDPARPTNTWKLTGLGFTFPQNVTLPPGGYVILAQTNEATMRALYGIPAAVPIFQYSGSLQDSGENLELQRPDAPTTNGVPYITTDAVRYNDKLPWPVAADGAGPSLQRLVANAYGNEPTNWFASGVTPGRANEFNAAPAVALTAPEPNSTFIPPTSITLSAAASDADGTVTNVEFYANGTFIGADTVAPFGVVWSNAVAGSYSLTARAFDQEGAVTISPAVPVVIFQPVPVTVIPRASTWRYLDDGSNQGSNWVSTNFNDSAWRTGVGQLGYGDGDETTVVEDNATPGYNAADANRYITTYFRKSVVITNAARFLSLAVNVLRDDGAVVYLNGVEVFRSNMPQGPVNHLTAASGSVGGADETSVLYGTNVAPALLFNGTNVIAVEIHQNSPGSSDMSFDLELTGTLGPVQPRIEITTPATNAFFTEPAEIVINASATDIDGQLTSVRLLQNGTQLVQFANPPYSFTWSNVSRGSYTLTAIAQNDSGLLRTSAPVTITVVTNVAPLVAITNPVNGAAFNSPNNLAIEAHATDANGSVARVEFFSGGTKLGEDFSAPFSFTWPVAPFGSHALYAVATDNQNARATSGVVHIGVLNFTSSALTVISTGSTWRYLDNGTDQGTAWTARTFNDSAWSSGPAQLGYGDNDEATRVEDNATPGYNAADQNRYITTYFRRGFEVTNAAQLVNATMRCLRDDGIIVYLNGVEVFRNNMPGSGVNHLTPASSSAAGADESTFYSTNLPVELFVSGTNVIAAEVHQQSAASSDMSFDLELTVTLGTAAPVITSQPESLTVPAGTNVTFTASAAGTAPLSYQWRLNGTNVPGATSASLTRNNVSSGMAGNYVLVAANAYGSATSRVAVLTVLNGDSDNDGLPDSWEQAFGLNPFNGADAALDSDGDGHANWQEFRTGTNPTNATSVLRVTMTSLLPRRVQFVAQPDIAYAVQVSSNGLGGAWLVLSNVAPKSQTRTVLVNDATGGTNAVRIYRALTP